MSLLSHWPPASCIPSLSPEIAAFALSGSTLIVAINAPMLKRTKLARHRALLRKPAGCTGSRKGSCAKNKGW
jgi:Cu2+-exporting ATPase